eukprot:m.22083 g.22083  ORF g.22083 m.22083 type:complete len:1365 (+) comp3704_c0_seq1:43-4137(+)
MEDSPQDVFFTNLLLLGFKPDAMEAKHKVAFSRDMFVSQNKKGMEIIFYFLFSTLSPQQAKDEFRFCWPIVEPKQESVFKKVLSTWLSKLEQADPDCKLPKLGPALTAPAGHKFYVLLAAFSTYVMRKRMAADCGAHGQVPKITVNPAAAPAAYARLLRAHIARLTNRFVERSARSVAAQTAWKDYAAQLAAASRHADQQYREVVRTLRGLQVPEAPDEVYTMETAAQARAPRVSFAREVWARIEQLVAMTTGERALLSSVVKREANSVGLNASALPLQIPDAILTAWERLAQREHLVDAYHGGKLQLMSFVKIWNVALQLLTNALGSGVAPQADTIADVVETLVHTHAATSAQARALHTMLEASLVPSVQESITALRSSLSQMEARMAVSHHPAGPIAQPIPQTPKLSFSATPARPGPMAATFASTPDAVSAITRSVLRAARRPAAPAAPAPAAAQTSGRSQDPSPVPSATPPAPATTAAAQTRPHGPSRLAGPSRGGTQPRPARAPSQARSELPRAQPGGRTALSILAGHVADMYMADDAGSPRYHAGDDVLESMGQDAFAHRSKLASTPVRGGTHPHIQAPAALEASPAISPPSLTMSSPLPRLNLSSSPLGGTPSDATPSAAPASHQHQAHLSPIYAPDSPHIQPDKRLRGAARQPTHAAPAPVREPSPSAWEDVTGAREEAWLNAAADIALSDEESSHIVDGGDHGEYRDPEDEDGHVPAGSGFMLDGQGHDIHDGGHDLDDVGQDFSTNAVEENSLLDVHAGRLVAGQHSAYEHDDNEASAGGDGPDASLLPSHLDSFRREFDRKTSQGHVSANASLHHDVSDGGLELSSAGGLDLLSPAHMSVLSNASRFESFADAVQRATPSAAERTPAAAVAGSPFFAFDTPAMARTPAAASVRAPRVAESIMKPSPATSSQPTPGLHPSSIQRSAPGSTLPNFALDSPAANARPFSLDTPGGPHFSPLGTPGLGLGSTPAIRPAGGPSTPGLDASELGLGNQGLSVTRAASLAAAAAAASPNALSPSMAPTYRSAQPIQASAPAQDSMREPATPARSVLSDDEEETPIIFKVKPASADLPVAPPFSMTAATPAVVSTPDSRPVVSSSLRYVSGPTSLPHQPAPTSSELSQSLSLSGTPGAPWGSADPGRKRVSFIDGLADDSRDVSFSDLGDAAQIRTPVLTLPAGFARSRLSTSSISSPANPTGQYSSSALSTPGSASLGPSPLGHTPASVDHSIAGQLSGWARPVESPGMLVDDLPSIAGGLDLSLGAGVSSPLTINEHAGGHPAAGMLSPPADFAAPSDFESDLPPRVDVAALRARLARIKSSSASASPAGSAAGTPAARPQVSVAPASGGFSLDFSTFES